LAYLSAKFIELISRIPGACYRERTFKEDWSKVVPRGVAAAEQALCAAGEMTGLRLKELGFRLILFPLSALLATTRVILATVRADDAFASIVDSLTPFGEYTDVVGPAEIRRLGELFAGAEVRASR
jgi:hypothetical protein